MLLSPRLCLWVLYLARLFMARKLDHILWVTKKESYGTHLASLDSLTSREFKSNFVPPNSNYLKSPPLFFSTFISIIPHLIWVLGFKFYFVYLSY